MGSSKLAAINVTILDNAALRFVPPAPSSTIIKSDVVKSALMSDPPSISKLFIEKAPASAPTYVLILDAAVFLLVPPAPSSTINKSASAKFALMSVPPSISKAAKSTLPAVDIVANFESAIAALDLMSAFTMFVIVLLSESIDLFVKVCVAAIPAIVSVVAGRVSVVLPEKAE